MKNALILFDIAALVGTAFWVKSAHFDYEPVVLFITLLGALIGLLIKGDALVGGTSNTAVVKGRNHKVTQTIKTPTPNQPQSNHIQVQGNDHDVQQEL